MPHHQALSTSKKDSAPGGGFYVEADLAYDPPTSSNNTVKMMLSISNEETMVAINCLNFTSYNCSQYSNCSQSESKTLINFPSFSTYAQNGHADMYLDYNYWSFASSISSFSFAQGCQTSDSNVGNDRYGVIGLGAGFQSKYNFLSSKVFSFYVESDLSAGKLLFENDATTYAESSEPVLVLSANSTWQTLIKNEEGSGDGNLAFDINSDAIAFPDVAYQTLVMYLQYFGIQCESASYRPICNSAQKIQDLPDLSISINESDLDIPHQIYATAINETESGSSFYLNFRGTDPNLFDKSYVTPAFQNSIILDSHFMSYYYTVFDFSTGENLVYLYKSKNAASHLNLKKKAQITF